MGAQPERTTNTERVGPRLPNVRLTNTFGFFCIDLCRLISEGKTVSPNSTHSWKSQLKALLWDASPGSRTFLAKRDDV